jgi:hypothetical protein
MGWHPSLLNLKLKLPVELKYQKHNFFIYKVHGELGEPG